MGSLLDQLKGGLQRPKRKTKSAGKSKMRKGVNPFASKKFAKSGVKSRPRTATRPRFAPQAPSRR